MTVEEQQFLVLPHSQAHSHQCWFVLRQEVVKVQRYEYHLRSRPHRNYDKVSDVLYAMVMIVLCG